MRRSFYDLFDALWAADLEPAMMPRATKAVSPALNVLESDEAYILQVAAPGWTKEDVSVRLDEDGSN